MFIPYTRINTPKVEKRHQKSPGKARLYSKRKKKCFSVEKNHHLEEFNQEKMVKHSQNAQNLIYSKLKNHKFQSNFINFLDTFHFLNHNFTLKTDNFRSINNSKTPFFQKNSNFFYKFRENLLPLGGIRSIFQPYF